MRQKCKGSDCILHNNRGEQSNNSWPERYIFTDWCRAKIGSCLVGSSASQPLNLNATVATRMSTESTPARKISNTHQSLLLRFLILVTTIGTFPLLFELLWHLCMFSVSLHFYLFVILQLTYFIIYSFTDFNQITLKHLCIFFKPFLYTYIYFVVYLV